METFSVLLFRMLALLFMMACGYFSYKKNWVSQQGYANLSVWVANVFNPLLLLNAVNTADDSITREQIGQNMILVVIYFAVLIALGFVLPFCIRAKREEKYQYNLMTVFSNVGFIAIPVLSALYGNAATIYIVFYIMVFNILIYSYGIVLAAKTGSGKVKLSAKLLLNPGLMGAVAAIILYFTGFRFGDPYASICNYMGNATIPLSMFLTGISIAMFPVKELVASVRVYIWALIKLLVIPILAALIIKQFVEDPMIRTVFVYEIAMPVGTLVLALNKNYGENEIVSSRGIVITTILSIITIPLVSFFI